VPPPWEISYRILSVAKTAESGLPKICSLSVWARTDLIVSEDSSNWFKLACLDDSKEPMLLTNHLEILGNDHMKIRLSDGARRCIDTPNAGGTSEWSEAISFELLNWLYGAQLLRTEMEIEYRCGSKITDYSIMLNGQHLGVSVTRAMAFQKVFDLAEARRLLEKKLNGVIASTRGVIKQHRWSRQILHIIAENADYVPILKQAYAALDPVIQHDTIVLITVADTNAGFMF